MAAAVAAAATRIIRGRLVSLAVPCAFLLGVLWLACARNIAAVLEGSAAADDDYFERIRWPLTVAILCLVHLAVRCWGEARAVADLAAGGVGCPDGNAVDALAFCQLYLICGIIMLVGKMFELSGARGLLKDPAAEWAAYQMKIGTMTCNGGFMSLYVVHCCFTIPYFVLRLMWSLRDKRVVH